MGASVTLNFGPHFWLPPPELRNAEADQASNNVINESLAQSDDSSAAPTSSNILYRVTPKLRKRPQSKLATGQAA